MEVWKVEREFVQSVDRKPVVGETVSRELSQLENLEEEKASGRASETRELEKTERESR